ncbi:PGF-pre-PGF domain-containing protein [Methanomethylovorans sp.]|uniref:PGF-pre-PGF domain-containing protein n=1 Tax=Methanomethylovorans sp. TaxID=2758717 RepID=UPI00345EBF78
MKDLEEIQYVTENEHLTFDVIAWNEKNINDILTFDVRSLPEGATFTQSPNDPNTYIFSWTPGPGTARSYPYRVTFIATSSDGYDDEDEDVRIFVRELDKTTLLNTILSTTGKIKSVVPGNEVGQYPQAAIDAFRIAIDTAQGVADDPTVTQKQIDDAVIALNNAETIFNAARITSIDKSALTAAITAANTKVTTASPGTEIGQYPQESIKTFNDAINKARAVLNDPSATQTQVNRAIADLKDAEATFETSRVTIRDQTPPAPVTDLHVSGIGTNWVHWTWTNPTDADFSHVMVYIDGVLVTNTQDNHYNATGFTEGTVHTIGIQTVDTAGNINPTMVTDQATTMIINTTDTTPPASVTNLRETATGTNWIHWEWTNPPDADFSHVMVYLDNVFVTNTSNGSYYATGLGDVYISDLNLKDEWVKIMNSGSFAVDLTGWEIKDEGDLHTYKFPSFQLGAGEAVTLYTTKGTNTGTELYWGSGGFVWNDDGDTAYLYNSGGYLLDSLKGRATHTMKATSHVLSTRTVDISGNINTTWVNDSATTSSSSSSGSSGGSGGGGSSKKSSSGGGGGAGSVEDFANIALKDVATRYLRMNAYVTYEFTREGNPIQSISFYSLKNSGEIASTIEVLNGRSKLVPMNPNGLLYKYINIWVGKAGFATPANIGNTQVRFIVSNSWMEKMGINPSNIKLQRYNGSAWEVLPTTFESNITDHAVFESRTPGFSPFAITAEKEPTYSLNSDSEADQTHTTDTAMEKTKPKKSNIWTYIMAFLLIAILAIGYEYLKRK